jgi:hypothetical protein
VSRVLAQPAQLKTRSSPALLPFLLHHTSTPRPPLLPLNVNPCPLIRALILKRDISLGSLLRWNCARRLSAVFVGWLAVVRAQCDNQTASSSNTPPSPVRRASHQRVWPLYRAGRKQLLQANYGGVSYADVAVVCAVHFGAQNVK